MTTSNDTITRDIFWHVSRVWDDGVPCASCEYCQIVKEERPYGGVDVDISVYESFRECDILDNRHPRPNDCPGLELESEDD